MSISCYYDLNSDSIGTAITIDNKRDNNYTTLDNTMHLLYTFFLCFSYSQTNVEVSRP